MRNKALATFIIALLFPALCHAADSLYILGIDESGSYGLRPEVMKAVERFIRALEPGDTLHVRRITDKSYIDGDETQLLPVPLKIPAAPPEFTQAAPTNRINLMAHKKHAQAKAKSQRLAQEATARAAALKEAAIRHIQGIKPLKSPKTDIYGFLAASADRLGNGETNYSRKMIIIASDMQDNCKRKLDLDLSGTEVAIMAFEKDLDPKKSRALREEWIKILTAMKAASVTFLNMDDDIVVIAKRQLNKSGMSVTMREAAATEGEPGNRE